jgi:hydroxymethylglutaryl-CoA lyase
MVEIIECPRDAMQGLNKIIPTETKVMYLKQLMHVGFYGLDFGSFVSAKAIPQMEDTPIVTQEILNQPSKSKLIVIVANMRGAIQASKFTNISNIGFPFSISETFQLRNTNSTIEESLHRVADILDICHESGKEAIIYLSMGLGNPYGDPWSPELAMKWVSYLSGLGVKTISISDTIGIGNPNNIAKLFSDLTLAFPSIKFGAHLHTQPHNWEEKIEAAYESGCRRFDGAIFGYGGCPMAKEELTGNMPTEHIVDYFSKRNIETGIDMEHFDKAKWIAKTVFSIV